MTLQTVVSHSQTMVQIPQSMVTSNPSTTNTAISSVTSTATTTIMTVGSTQRMTAVLDGGREGDINLATISPPNFDPLISKAPCRPSTPSPTQAASSTPSMEKVSFQIRALHYCCMEQGSDIDSLT